MSDDAGKVIDLMVEINASLRESYPDYYAHRDSCPDCQPFVPCPHAVELRNAIHRPVSATPTGEQQP